jgi:hypothetical protein
MEWLNYQNLRYFWTVANEGGLKQAAIKQCLTGHAQRLIGSGRRTPMSPQVRKPCPLAFGCFFADLLTS